MTTKEIRARIQAVADDLGTDEGSNPERMFIVLCQVAHMYMDGAPCDRKAMLDGLDENLDLMDADGNVTRTGEVTDDDASKTDTDTK